MNEERPDGVMMIGLHKLAAQRGDGLVPELYELLLRNAERRRDYPNVSEFPLWEARMPGQKPLGLEAANGNNVVAFAAARAGAKNKA
ncbi:hypothetical protein ATY81_13680 [Rhizobium sp. R72]|uniref:hypothetical protein n=1 Tax=unclassified Rhizobium TaxID=2613769 RepID=UPI000B52B425|nr:MULTISPECIES: hypothetical protein [unclassified Rhizobium]OWV82889.1 hypothetical protein ATY79_16015 [Rhizobium sp. R693]OWV93672.1 hypothetical protein ATY81_13680 [Rhizobium sp. R72]OWV93910.1 hypothetical protein ATY80_13680 [Rhizobium sp. R711]